MSAAEAVAPATSVELEAQVADLRAALAEETRRADALNRIAAAIGAGDDLTTVVQAVTDGGVELSGAAFGAFFYNVQDDRGESYTLYTLSGAPRSAFENFPMPRNTQVFHPTFVGEPVVRSDDITQDPRYGQNKPYFGMPEGHLPVRSYLAASVISRTGEVLGGLFFGHSRPGVFSERHEALMTGLAAQAAVAIDNVRLNDAARREVEVRRRAETALEASMRAESAALQRLQFALQAARLGSWELDVDSRAYQASDLCKANYGRTPDDPFGFDNLLAAVHPDDLQRVQAAIDATIETGAAYDLEYRVLHPSGETRWVHARGRAAREGEGRVRRMAGVSLDVTERKRAEERQRLLLNELNHRVKNTLATVQSIASQTLRSAGDLAAFRGAFEARLLALSQTHNLLTDRNWEAASLHEILRLELTPHAGGREGGGSRFLLDSDGDIRVSPKAAVALGMAVHELATNAVKYGALSTPSGRVEVRTRVEARAGGPTLVVDWRESGGPPVTPPTRRGFGGRVLQQGLAGELDGDVHLEYRPEGLSCRMQLPLHALEPTE